MADLNLSNAVDESVPSQQGLKPEAAQIIVDEHIEVDESVPSQQGLKLRSTVIGSYLKTASMSPFHHNKD